MTPERVDKVLDDSTAGLKDDPELRFDIRKELASHIRAAAEARRAEGKSDEESTDLALQSFGPATEIAADLLSANRRRLQMRAWARLAARSLLVPAAVVVALVIGYSQMQAWASRSILRELVTVKSSGIDQSPPGRFLGVLALCQRETGTSPLRDERVKFLFSGDLTRSSMADQQKAIWESDPTNRMYFGNYITCLVKETRDPTNRQDIIAVEEALRKGEQLDPDNARYNYLLASYWLQLACEMKNKKEADGKNWVEWVVRDRALLDKAMVEFQEGQHKPFLKTYTRDMQAFRSSLLRPSRTMAESIAKIGMVAGILLPDTGRYRTLARASVLYGQQLLAEGKKDEAMVFLESWYPFSVQMIENSWTLIEELVGFAIMNIGKDRAVPLMESAGASDRASDMKARAERLLQPKEEWDASRKHYDPGHLIKRKGGILMGLLVPAIGGEGAPSDQELRSERLTWYVILERAGMLTFLASFLLLMLIMLLITLRWRRTPGFASAPLLMLPDAGNMMAILGFSVGAPLAVYFVYTRYSGLSVHEFSPFFYWQWFLLELGGLAWVISFLSVWFSVRHISRRCRNLDIAVPATLSPFRMAVITLIPFGLPFWLIRGKKEGLFRGTVARSLIPVFASVVILVGIITAPYLSLSERRLVETNPLFVCLEEGEGFTNIETRLVQRLRAEVLDAAEAIERGQHTEQ